MYIHGQFINRKGKVITIEILSKETEPRRKSSALKAVISTFKTTPLK